MTEEEELIAEVDQYIEEQSKTAFDRRMDKCPALKEAYEQIQIIRHLKGKTENTKGKPAWEVAYNRVLEGLDTQDPALKEAWDAFYTIKALTQDLK